MQARLLPGPRRIPTAPEGPTFGALEALGKALDRDANGGANCEEKGKKVRLVYQTDDFGWHGKAIRQRQ